MRSIEKFRLMPIATIKSHRHKVFQAIKPGDSITYIVKCMTLTNYKQFLWIRQQIGERLDVLKHINNSGILQIIQKGIFEVEVKESDQNSIFFIKKQIRGYPLRKILENQRLTISIIMSKDIKELIWNILALIIGGGGHSNLIISLDNIIFASQGKSYKAVLNYFSFIGYHLLKFKKNIERKQYLEIAIFLDEEVLETGDMDRFQFKVRNFALLILSLILRKDITADIFQGVDLPPNISLANARQYLRKYIQPQINSILKFQYLKKVYSLLKIPGLQELIQSALCSEKQSGPQRDWNSMNKLLLNNQDEKQGYFRLPRLMWENQHEWVRKMLETKGLGIGENGEKIYLAFKISTHLECLLQNNSWKSMMKKLGYNYRTDQMFYRLLQCASLSHSKVLEETAIQLYQLSKDSFVSIGRKDNRVIYTCGYQRTALDDMMRYCN